MSEGMEIERKFLVGFPQINDLDVRRRISIEQTYLINGENGSQRRVRRIEDNGKIMYTYTEKVFITSVTRKEDEYEIDEVRYRELLKEKKSEYVPIIKTRYCFMYLNQFFELDTYPFSEKYAVMELELESPEQEIFFPDNVNVIREVTGEKLYSNAELAKSGRFPED